MAEANVDGPAVAPYVRRMPLVRDLSSHARFVLGGADRARFLHGMVSNDIQGLKPGDGCRALLLTVKGKLVADLLVYADADTLLLETDAEVRANLRQVLEGHMILDDVTLNDITDSSRETGVYGEDAAAAIARALGAELPPLRPYQHFTTGEVRVAATADLDLPCFHVFGDLHVKGDAIDEGEFEVLRVEAGRPRYGVDMDAERLPLEAGLLDAISFDKGCYLGQEVIARATNRGHINRKLVGLLLEGDSAVERGAKLSAPSRADAGAVTSSVFSPRLGRAIALGYVHRSLWDPGTRLSVNGRTAEVVPLPFVK